MVLLTWDLRLYVHMYQLLGRGILDKVHFTKSQNLLNYPKLDKRHYLYLYLWRRLLSSIKLGVLQVFASNLF